MVDGLGEAIGKGIDVIGTGLRLRRETLLETTCGETSRDTNHGFTKVSKVRSAYR